MQLRLNKISRRMALLRGHFRKDFANTSSVKGSVLPMGYRGKEEAKKMRKTGGGGEITHKAMAGVLKRFSIDLSASFLPYSSNRHERPYYKFRTV